MWTYNFGIHDLKNNKAHFYVWNETIAKRGSSDIGSCLMHFIEHHIPSSFRKLVLFSDNCCGQNKNLNLCLLFLRFIHSGRFDYIKHFFLVPGHSYMPCDRDFGRLQQFVHGHEVFTTPHYVEFMKEARVEMSTFNVVEMEKDSFFDLQPLQAMCTRTQVLKSKFKDGKMFKFSQDFKQGFGIWQSYNTEIDSTKNIKLQKGKGSAYKPEVFDLTTVNLPLKYPEGVKLKKEKLNDLSYLTRFLPITYQGWYTDLFTAQGRISENLENQEEDEDDVLDY